MIVPIYFGTSFLMIYPPHFFSFLHGFCSGAEAWTIPRVVRKPSCRWMLAAGCCRLNVSKNHSRIIRGSSKHQRSCLNLNSTFFLSCTLHGLLEIRIGERCWPRHFGSALGCLPSPVKAAMMSSLSTLAPRGGGVTLTPPWNDRVIRNQLMAENKWPSSLNQPCFISLMKHEQ